MTTRTAEANNHRCPYCTVAVKRDLKRRGFVVHKRRPAPDRSASDGLCPFERRQKSI